MRVLKKLPPIVLMGAVFMSTVLFEIILVMEDSNFLIVVTNYTVKF